MATRPDRIWLLQTWYEFDARQIAKYMPVGASQQTAKRKSMSKVSGNAMVAKKLANAKRCGYKSHYDRFFQDSEYRQQCISTLVGPFLIFEKNDESFERYAEQEYFDEQGIDVASEAPKVKLSDYLQGIGEDIFEPPDDQFDPNAESSGETYIPPVL